MNIGDLTGKRAWRVTGWDPRTGKDVNCGLWMASADEAGRAEAIARAHGDPRTVGLVLDAYPASRVVGLASQHGHLGCPVKDATIR